MSDHGYCPSSVGLETHGLTELSEVYWNLSPAELCDHALARGEGKLAATGALVCSTGEHTGRSPKDKFIVEEPGSKADIWWGSVNQPMSEAHFDKLHAHMLKHFRGKKAYVRDAFAGADASTTLPLRVVTEDAWHNLFASQLFIRPDVGSTAAHKPSFVVMNAPTCLANPAEHGTNSSTFVVLNFAKRIVLIGGTAYAGEIKKSIFSVMNYELPRQNVFSMHCSANVGKRGDVALFFGLSGTGKTTLSADPHRRLIGDDEHGWGDGGVFNIEGGCYAKCINLTEAAEPQIFHAIRFGSVLENVVVDPATREPDYEDTSLTENTRAAYPLEYIDGAVLPSIGGHPKNVVFLTCDAFGVLPPVSRLSPEQAMYHFLSGYTAKVAGTERGVTEPQATFSTCFGAPFLPLPPERYAEMLRDRLSKHGATCWLINTGWSGGEFGVGKRINLGYTRSMVRAVLMGKLDDVDYSKDSVFGLHMPVVCPDVPTEILNPKSTWADQSAYDRKAKELAGLFVENIKKFDGVSDEVVAAGPQL